MAVNQVTRDRGRVQLMRVEHPERAPVARARPELELAAAAPIRLLRARRLRVLDEGVCLRLGAGLLLLGVLMGSDRSLVLLYLVGRVDVGVIVRVGLELLLLLLLLLRVVLLVRERTGGLRDLRVGVVRGEREVGVKVVVVVLHVHQLGRDAGEVFVLLLEFHAPILEPNLDLPLGQEQVVRDLDAAPSR